jgi:hypothetical protein
LDASANSAETLAHLGLRFPPMDNGAAFSGIAAAYDKAHNMRALP